MENLSIIDLCFQNESAEKLLDATKTLTLVPEQKISAEVVTVDRAVRQRELLSNISRVFDNVNTRYGLNPSLSRQHLIVERGPNDGYIVRKRRSFTCNVAGGFAVHDQLPSHGLKAYKLASSTLEPASKPMLSADYIERFSKERITKCLNEKDAKLIYSKDEGMQGSRRKSNGVLCFKRPTSKQDDIPKIRRP